MFSLCLLAAVLSATLTGSTQTAPCPQKDPSAPFVNSWARNTTVYVDLGNLNAEQRRQVQQALELWNTANRNNNSGVNFQIGAPPPGGSVLTFQLGATSDGGAAQVDSTGRIDAGGHRTGATVTFNPNAMVPDSTGALARALDETAPDGGTAFLKAALHEIGHTMGLGHNTFPALGTNCGGQSLGASVMNALCGPNDYAGNVGITVTNCDQEDINTGSYPPIEGGGCDMDQDSDGVPACLDCNDNDPFMGQLCQPTLGGGGGDGGGGGGLGGVGGGGYTFCQNEYEWDSWEVCVSYGGRTECDKNYELVVVGRTCTSF
jgi:hypothetical protein